MIERQSAGRRHHIARWPLTAALGVAIWLCATDLILAQTGGCVLAADHHGPDKILRCGNGLTIHVAAKTHYRLTDQQGKEPPRDLELESGALLLEFVPSDHRTNFQILTPHAIAAVRGTKWAVDVTSDRTATLVISGAVEVKRRQSTQAAILRAGEGADVASGTAPIEVKRWKKTRVRALLARFGR